LHRGREVPYPNAINQSVLQQAVRVVLLSLVWRSWSWGLRLLTGVHWWQSSEEYLQQHFNVYCQQMHKYSIYAFLVCWCPAAEGYTPLQKHQEAATYTGCLDLKTN